MKILNVLVSMSTLLSATAFGAQSACVTFDSKNNNVAFTKTNDQPDREYGSLEKAKSKGITFYLRAGHGVIRLEAWKNGKLLANTFAQEGNQAPYGDSLTLAVQTSAGEVEAQCDGINAAVAAR